MNALDNRNYIRKTKHTSEPLLLDFTLNTSDERSMWMHYQHYAHYWTYQTTMMLKHERCSVDDWLCFHCTRAHNVNIDGLCSGDHVVSCEAFYVGAFVHLLYRYVFMLCRG